MSKFVAMFLSAMLVLTGQAVAFARGSPDPVGQMVLCTGHRIVTVFVDADGQPTNPPVHCPDCALQAFSDACGPAASCSLELTFREAHFAVEFLSHTETVRFDARVRGPPVLI